MPDAVSADLGLPLADWRRAGHCGGGVRIALLDSGADQAHPQLAGRVAASAVFDRNGRRAERPLRDETGHGTFDAVLLAQIAPKAELLLAEVIEGGATVWRVLSGIDWALSLGASIIVLPIGFAGEQPVLRPALARARVAGALTVAAVGNRGAGQVTAPARYPEVLAVGACDAAGVPARFSGSSPTGAPWRKPDILARGVDVPGSAPCGSVRSGTSMAAVVAGAAVAVVCAATSASPLAAAAELCVRARPLPTERSHRAAFGVLDLAGLDGWAPAPHALDVPKPVPGQLAPLLRKRLVQADRDLTLDVVVAASHSAIEDLLAPLAAAFTDRLPHLNAVRMSLRPNEVARLHALCPAAIVAPANPLVP